MSEITEKILIEIPELLAGTAEPECVMQKVLNKVQEVLPASKSAVYYLSEENAFLKQAQDKDYFDNFCLSFSVIEQLEECKFIDIDEKEITENSQNHYVSLFPLKINEAVFGFLCVVNPSKLSTCEQSAISALGGVAAYSLKDAELSSVFKSQLKMMQSGLSDKAQAVEEIKEENERILEADKVKSEFLANVSHELRTPLNAIIGFSEVLNSKIFGDLNEKQSEYINDIYSSGVHLLGMINEILDISKIESNAMSMHYTDFGLEGAIGEVVRVMKPLADKKNISLEYSCDEALAVTLDRQKFQQILYNLVGNAVKFTPEKGKIEIKVAKSKENLVIRVKDNGVGIPKDKQERIFEKFVQLDTPYTKTGSSTGLGLTITKKFVEMMQGEISVLSEQDKGAEFVVAFPVMCLKD